MAVFRVSTFDLVPGWRAPLGHMGDLINSRLTRTVRVSFDDPF